MGSLQVALTRAASRLDVSRERERWMPVRARYMKILCMGNDQVISNSAVVSGTPSARLTTY